MTSCVVWSSLGTAATHQHYQEWCDLGANGQLVSVAQEPKEKNPHKTWGELIPEGLENQEDINGYVQSQKLQKKAWKSVGGAGTFHPDAEGVRLQNVTRSLKTAVAWAWWGAKPFVLSGVADFIIGVGSPHVIKTTGYVAENVTSYAFAGMTKGVGYADQALRFTARKVAEGEIESRIGSFKPWLVEGIKATPAVVAGLQKVGGWAYSRVVATH